MRASFGIRRLGGALGFARLGLLAWVCGVLEVGGIGDVSSTGGGAEMVIVRGIGGEDSWAEDFRVCEQKWVAAAGRGGVGVEVVAPEGPGGVEGADGKGNQLERVRRTLGGRSKGGTLPLWVVMIGHGTFDGQEAKFNLEGPDLTAAELAKELRPFERPLVIIQGASASGAFMNEIRGPNRVVITATKSGFEQNYARFGKALATSVGDEASDLDHDGQVSVLEAYLAASYQTADFYKSDGRMLTEHALVDDNGDGKGTPSDWYRGIRPVKKSADGGALDGLRAHQIHLIPNARDRALSAEEKQKRDTLEMEVFRLRDRKGEMAEKEYFERLESVLLELGKIYPPGP